MTGQKVTLYKVTEKEDQTVYVITKGGIYFSLNRDNIEELKKIFADIENNSLIRPQE